MNNIQALLPARWLGRLYASLPSNALATADRLHEKVQNRCRLRVRLTLHEGQAGAGERPRRVVTVDEAPSLLHFVRPLFDEPPHGASGVSCLQRTLPQNLESLGKGAELLIARVSAHNQGAWLEEGWLQVPEAVECLAEMPPEQCYPARARRGQARNLRQLRRSGLRWELSHCEDDFETFYHRMYVPFARHRFGDLAYLRRKERLRAHFLRGGLIRTMDGQRPVGGTVYSVQGRNLRVWVVGLAEGDQALLERGVMTANWAFAFERAHELGLRCCHMGLSRPSLSDGVLVYKKRWGAALPADVRARSHLFVRWDRFNSLACRLLKHTPLLVCDGDGLAGLGVLEQTPTPEAVERVALDLAIPGMTRLCLLSEAVTQPRRVVMQDQRVRELPVQILPASDSRSVQTMLSESTQSWTAFEASPEPMAALEG